MFREDDNRPPSAPCYDRQENPPNIPSNAEFPQTTRNTRCLVSRLPAPHACRRGLSHLNPSQRTKEIYIYKTLLLPSTTEVNCVVNAVWNAMAACWPPHLLSTPSLTDTHLALPLSGRF